MNDLLYVRIQNFSPVTDRRPTRGASIEGPAIREQAAYDFLLIQPLGDILVFIR